ncbi:MAG: nitroreductase family protein [Treponemataceae bacterium]
MNAIIDNIMKRRSCRNYLSRTVRRKDIEAVLSAGSWAPSARNTQPCQFTVVIDTEKLDKINDFIKIKLEKPENYSFFYRSPTLIIISQVKAPLLAAANCACVAQNMLLAAESLHINSCWINQIGQFCNEPDVRAILSSFGIPSDHDVYACISLGYEAEKIESVPRKNIPIHWID